MKFDENLAATHAYLCSDGYVIKNPPKQKHKYYHVGFRNTNLVLLQDFQNRFYAYFKIKPYLIKYQRCGTGSKEIYELLTKEFGSFYSWEWSMPILDKHLAKIWLRAFFDCDSWVTVKSHQNRMIGLDCVNLDGLKQIQETLTKLGIKSKIKKRNTRNIYSLFIFGKDNIVKFKEEIGFMHPNKKDKLDKAIEDFVVYEWNFPINYKELVEFIRELMKNKVRIKKPEGIVRIISKIENNLIILQKNLGEIFDIESKVNKRVNGLGTIYYEMSINKKSEINKLIKHNLIAREAKIIWLKLKK